MKIRPGAAELFHAGIRTDVTKPFAICECTLISISWLTHTQYGPFRILPLLCERLQGRVCRIERHEHQSDSMFEDWTMQDRFRNLRFHPLLLGESNPSDGVLLIEAVLSSLVRGCRVDGDIFLVGVSDTRLLPQFTTWLSLMTVLNCVCAAAVGSVISLIAFVRTCRPCVCVHLNGIRNICRTYDKEYELLRWERRCSSENKRVPLFN